MEILLVISLRVLTWTEFALCHLPWYQIQRVFKSAHYVTWHFYIISDMYGGIDGLILLSHYTHLECCLFPGYRQATAGIPYQPETQLCKFSSFNEFDKYSVVYLSTLIQWRILFSSQNQWTRFTWINVDRSWKQYWMKKASCRMLCTIL